jgi:hypothetical protein
MSLPEIPGDVVREFDELVQSHVKAHQKDRWMKTATLLLLGLVAYSQLSNFPFATSVALIVLAALGSTVWFTKPDLSLTVSNDEIEQLTDGARTVFSRVMRTHWDRGVVLSDLDSIVRISSEKQRVATRARQRAEANRQARAQQEHALHARREQEDD